MRINSCMRFSWFTSVMKHLLFSPMSLTRSFDTEVMDDEESGLKLIPVAIISNEVTHE